MQDRTETPTGASLRPSLSTLHLTALAERGRTVSYKKGEALFLRDDPGDHIVIVLEGLIEISITAASGRKSVLAHIGAQELIGEISVIDGENRSTDAIALKASRVVKVPRSTFLEFLSEDSDAMLEMLQALCARIRNASDMFETQSLTSASARLARCIVLLARKWGVEQDGTVTIGQKFSQTELGALAGLARENVNRYMRNWSQDGVLQIERGVITVLDFDALVDESEASDG